MDLRDGLYMSAMCGSTDEAYDDDEVDPDSQV